MGTQRQEYYRIASPGDKRAGEGNSRRRLPRTARTGGLAICADASPPPRRSQGVLYPETGAGHIPYAADPQMRRRKVGAGRGAEERVN